MRGIYFGLGLLLTVSVLLFLAACAPASPVAPPAPAATAAPAPAQAPTVAPKAAAPAAPAAAAAPTASAVKAKPEGTLVIAKAFMGNETLLPLSWPAGSKDYGDLMYEYLVYATPKGQLIPGLAEKWSSSPDGTRWTFDIRKGVKFHENWGELTAEDVKYSLDMLTGKESTNSAGLQAREWYGTVEVTNPYQVVVNTKPGGYALVVADLGVWGALPIFSKKYVESVGVKKANEAPIGTGPFKFVDRRLGEYLKLEAVEDHWRVVPAFKNVTMKPVPEASTRLAMIRTKEADIADIPVDKTDEAKKAGLDVRINPMAFSTWIGFAGQYLPSDRYYVASEPYHKKEVRQALALAINREEVAQHVFMGTAVPASVPIITPGALGWRDLKPYPYDPQKAKELLAQAGYGKGLEMTIKTFPLGGVPELPQLGEAVAQYWENIGVKVKLMPTQFDPLMPELKENRASGYAMPIRYSGYYDQGRIMNMFFGPTNTPYTAWGGTTAYLEGLHKQLLGEMDLKKRDELLGNMAQHIYDEYMVAPLAYTSQLFVVTKQVGDWPFLQGVMTLTGVEYITHAK